MAVTRGWWQTAKVGVGFQSCRTCGCVVCSEVCLEAFAAAPVNHGFVALICFMVVLLEGLRHEVLPKIVKHVDVLLSQVRHLQVCLPQLPACGAPLPACHRCMGGMLSITHGERQSAWIAEVVVQSYPPPPPMA